MKSLLQQSIVLMLAGVTWSYPSYTQDGRFFYQVPIQATHGHLLASLTPQQQQFVQQADPFASSFYSQQPLQQVGGIQAQDNKVKRPVNQQQLLGQQLLGQQVLGQHQLLYFGQPSDGTEEGGTGAGGPGTGSSGGYVDSFLGLLGSYWPGQVSPPDNTLQPAKPPVEGSVVGEESQPEKPEDTVAPAVPSVGEPARQYYLAPAVRAPQRPSYSSIKQPQFQLADFHREMFDGGLSAVKPGNAAISFQKMLAAARLKATHAGTKAALAEQEAQSISAEEGKDENDEKSDSSEQEQYGPSIAQAKPQAVSVAGPGGVAAAAPVGTAVVGPGGMALSAPHATAVAGASRRPQAPQDDKIKVAFRHGNIPRASQYLKY